MSERAFELVSTERVFDGRIFAVDSEVYRFADGEEAPRDIIRHPGAVGVVCFDDEHLWLVRQPREAVGNPDMLEIPAGKLDEEGEDPLDTAKRELGEEIGKAATEWEHLITFFTSVGVMDERIHLFLATGLSDVTAEAPDENERIEIVRWPLADLEGAIAATRDSKTLIGLMMLERRRRAAAA